MKFSEGISEGTRNISGTPVISLQEIRLKKARGKRNAKDCDEDRDKHNRRTQGDNKNSFRLSVSASAIRRESTLLLA